MAKALLGYVHSDLRDPRADADNARLRQRVAELESLGLLRGIRFAIGQRRRALLPSARRR